MIKNIELPCGETLPPLGLGTWRYGEQTNQREQEVLAIRSALELGYRLIDTAEMYGDGGAEQVLGEALTGALISSELQREELFIVSKVYPHHASLKETIKACERSLKRLRLDYLDLYLLHWRGTLPLEETIEAFEALKGQGKIRHWGVSNFDVQDLNDLLHVDTAKHRSPMCAINQVYYSLNERGAEFSLLPLMRSHRVPLMAYSPIDQGALANHPALLEIEKRHQASAAQIALAWILRQQNVIVIPKAVKLEHLKENWQAQEIVLSAQDLAELERYFPAPVKKYPLAMI